MEEKHTFMEWMKIVCKPQASSSNAVLAVTKGLPKKNKKRKPEVAVCVGCKTEQEIYAKHRCYKCYNLPIW